MKRFFSVLCTLLLCIPAFFAVMAETADDLFSDKDLTLADPSEAVDIVLTEGGVDITEPGVYRLSGQVADGSIRVAPATEGDVWLLLDGVSVHNEDGAALTSDGCDKLILTLAEGSVNSLTQGSATPAEEDNDAAIYVRDDLTINGNGALTNESAWLDGINCRDSLRIVSGDITGSAVDDGLVGKDAAAHVRVDHDTRGVDDATQGGTRGLQCASRRVGGDGVGVDGGLASAEDQLPHRVDGAARRLHDDVAWEDRGDLLQPRVAEQLLHLGQRAQSFMLGRSCHGAKAFPVCRSTRASIGVRFSRSVMANSARVAFCKYVEEA